MDFLDGQSHMWLTPVVGGERTFQQYTGQSVRVDSEQDLEEMRQLFEQSFPAEHLAFMQDLPFYYEDEFAIYVHAGLDEGKHPRESSPMSLLWMRDMDFYKNYRGKPCVFGHTPTPLLPLRGRLGRHGIYISHSAVGLDTGYNHQSPLSCLSLPDFNLYQTFADGREETYQITSFIPETLREMQRKAGLSVNHKIYINISWLVLEDFSLRHATLFAHRNRDPNSSTFACLDRARCARRLVHHHN